MGATMRKAMICISVMLALFQLLPMLYGHRMSTSAAQAAVSQPVSKRMEAVAIADKMPQMTPASVSVPGPKTCYRQYRVKYDRCQAGDRACHAKMADQWDLCEATGMWPK